MGRREKHQIDPLARHQWRTRQRMKAGELDGDLGALLLAMGESFARDTPAASQMLRAMQATLLGLFERLECGSTQDLMTHTRAVSQFDALARSIRIAGQHEHASPRARRQLFSTAPMPARGDDVDMDDDSVDDSVNESSGDDAAEEEL